MTPTEQRNQRLGEKMIQHLERRHFEAYYCSDKDSAVKKILEIIVKLVKKLPKKLMN